MRRFDNYHERSSISLIACKKKIPSIRVVARSAVTVAAAIAKLQDLPADD
jgi:hypothetical protein